METRKISVYGREYFFNPEMDFVDFEEANRDALLHVLNENEGDVDPVIDIYIECHEMYEHLLREEYEEQMLKELEKEWEEQCERDFEEYWKENL